MEVGSRGKQIFPLLANLPFGPPIQQSRAYKSFTVSEQTFMLWNEIIEPISDG